MTNVLKCRVIVHDHMFKNNVRSHYKQQLQLLNRSDEIKYPKAL